MALVTASGAAESLDMTTTSGPKEVSPPSCLRNETLFCGRVHFPLHRPGLIGREKAELAPRWIGKICVSDFLLSRSPPGYQGRCCRFSRPARRAATDRLNTKSNSNVNGHDSPLLLKM
jgi:hypothetical protein